MSNFWRCFFIVFFAYTLVKSGRLDKKKNEKKNLAVLEDEAVIVQKIFDLYVKHGYGMHKIVYCMDCGSRLIVATNGRYVNENGERYKHLRYMCYGKSRKQTD